MNKLIVIATLALAGSPALASKARVATLGNSRQLVDVQYTFERPYLLSSVGDLATLEWGGTGDAASPHAEGGFFKKSGDDVFGLYFGRRSTDFDASVTAVNAAGGALLREQNPINVFYGSKSGDLTWGVTVKYSNGKSDTLNKKVSTTGFAAGVTNGTWDVQLVQGLSGKSEQTGVTLESKGNTKIGFGYNLSDMMHAYVDSKTTKGEGVAGGVTTATETSAMNLGFINTLVKSDEANFFYGVSYSTTSSKVGAAEATTTALPVWMGLEANATSWMVLRSSLQQNVLINDSKTVAGVKSDTDSIAFNAGAGFKLGKGMLDVNFSSTDEAAGEVNFAKSGFFGTAGYTYNF